MKEGINKYAPYISDIFINHLKVYDPMRQPADIVFFDGVTNVQKAGEIIEAVYPRVTSLHGVDNCVYLFFCAVL